MRFFKLTLTLVVLCLAPAVLAQSDCAALVQAALDTADSACGDTARNQACYGNVVLEATPREDANDFRFEQAGDIANIADLQSLKLSSMSLTDEVWGVALLRLQANLPDTLPGQNVTFLLFGDVNMADASSQIVELPVTASGGVNVRLRPSTDASVLLSLRRGQEVTATGQLPDGSWIRVRLEDSSVGWVSADFVDGDVGRLLPVEPGAPAFGPMQAFTFASGHNDRPCAEAPDSGILIQTPQGAGTIQLRANHVDIRLGSTVYLQAAPGDALYVNVVEGHAALTALGETQIVPAGTFSTVPLDANGVADGPPAYPAPYDRETLQALPLDMALFEETVTVERGVPENQIPAAIDLANGIAPSGGQWIYTQTTTHIPDAACFPDDNFVAGAVETLSTSITFSEDRATMTLEDVRHEVGGPGDRAALILYRNGDGSYVGNYFSGVWVLTFTSPTTFVGTTIGWSSNPDCSWDRSYAGSYQP